MKDNLTGCTPTVHFFHNKLFNWKSAKIMEPLKGNGDGKKKYEMSMLLGSLPNVWERKGFASKSKNVEILLFLPSHIFITMSL